MSNSQDQHARHVISVLFLTMAVIMPGFYILESSINTTTSHDKRVCAFYYTWYANTTIYPNEHPINNDIYEHWNKSNAPFEPYKDLMITNHPSMGFSVDQPILYDSADEELIDYHLNLADRMGIDTFITTWWGENNSIDTNFDLLLNVTKDNGYEMQHTIYFESAQLKYEKANPEGVDNICYDIKYVIDSYGEHDNYLRINNRPVIFAFNVYSAATAKNWTDAINRLHDDGYYPYLIVDVGYQAPLGQQELDMFDGVHLYNPSQRFLDDFDQTVEDMSNLKFYSDINKKLFCATVLPGYNDTALDKEIPVPVYPRNGGATYNQTWDVALGLDADWILITTFNEWHEGSELEPSIQNGDLYVNITEHYVEEFKENT